MSHRKDETTELKNSVNLASDHYENFPTASFLFPKELRNDVALIYRFARTADDIVDEGNESDEIKLNKLNDFRNEFIAALKKQYENNFWKLLENTITTKKLIPQNFLDLLSAFEQDIHKKEYYSYDELLDYCSRSANSVGRIVLELYDIREGNIVQLSDKICTALQLTNFWQDVSLDLEKNRIYIPLEDFTRYGTEKSILKSEQIDENLRQIIMFEVDRTKQLFFEGSKILDYLPVRLRWQIKWTLNGGLKILEKIRKNHYDILNCRPTLNKLDYISALLKPLKINAK